MSRYTVVRRIRDDGLTYEWVVVHIDTGGVFKTMAGTRTRAEELAARLRKEHEYV